MKEKFVCYLTCAVLLMSFSVGPVVAAPDTADEAVSTATENVTGTEQPLGSDTESNSAANNVADQALPANAEAERQPANTAGEDAGAVTSNNTAESTPAPSTSEDTEGKAEGTVTPDDRVETTPLPHVSDVGSGWLRYHIPRSSDDTEGAMEGTLILDPDKEDITTLRYAEDTEGRGRVPSGITASSMPMQQAATLPVTGVMDTSLFIFVGFASMGYGIYLWEMRTRES